MILTKITKDDFLKSLEMGEQCFTTIYSSRDKIAIIIEWLDFIGFYINVKSKFGQRKQCERFSFSVKNYNSGFIFDSRNEATVGAIKKANEIYNLKNK